MFLSYDCTDCDLKYAVWIMKVYVVFKGHTPGVYTTWMDCHAQVSGYPSNLHASFPSRKEGEEAYAQYQASMKRKILEVKQEGEEDVAQVHNQKLQSMTAKDAILVFLFLVVVIQAYLLYNA